MRPPWLLAITDRRQMGPEDVARIARPGVAIIVREKDLSARALFDYARAIDTIARPRGCSVLVTDRLDVARALGLGVQLPEDGLEIADARAYLGPGAIVSASRHDPAGVRAAIGADWITIAPVFPSASKPGLPGLGVESLARARAAAPPGARIYALGGIDAATAPLAWATGVDGVAAIRAAWAGDALERDA